MWPSSLSMKDSSSSTRILISYFPTMFFSLLVLSRPGYFRELQCIQIVVHGSHFHLKRIKARPIPRSGQPCPPVQSLHTTRPAPMLPQQGRRLKLVCQRAYLCCLSGRIGDLYFRRNLCCATMKVLQEFVDHLGLSPTSAASILTSNGFDVAPCVVDVIETLDKLSASVCCEVDSVFDSHFFNIAFRFASGVGLLR